MPKEERIKDIDNIRESVSRSLEVVKGLYPSIRVLPCRYWKYGYSGQTLYYLLKMDISITLLLRLKELKGYDLEYANELLEGKYHLGNERVLFTSYFMRNFINKC